LTATPDCAAATLPTPTREREREGVRGGEEIDMKAYLIATIQICAVAASAHVEEQRGVGDGLRVRIGH
jgi:hypothetical protein